MKRNLITHERQQFDEALRLRRKGRLNDALNILRKLHRNTSDDASVCGLIGEIHWRQGKLTSAIRWFGKATQAAPQSELASLGLFHALWEADKEDLALREMKRFLRVSNSAEYRAIQKDLQTSIS